MNAPALSPYEAEVASAQDLVAENARLRALAAEYWPAHAAERARAALHLSPAVARLLVALVMADGARRDWFALAPLTRLRGAGQPCEGDEQLVKTQMFKLRRDLDAEGLADRIRSSRDQGYALRPGAAAEILARIGVEPMDGAAPSPERAGD